MILQRILRYGIALLCIFLVLSCICLYQYRDYISTYFSNSISSALGIGLYILIFVVGIVLMLRALFK